MILKSLQFRYLGIELIYLQIIIFMPGTIILKYYKFYSGEKLMEYNNYKFIEKKKEYKNQNDITIIFID